MRTLGIQNTNQNFRALFIEKTIRQADMKMIKPYISAIKDLATDYDINLKSCSFLQKRKYFISPRPAIDITITPKDEADMFVSSSRMVMPIKDYKTDGETLFDIIKSTIRNVF